MRQNVVVVGGALLPLAFARGWRRGAAAAGMAAAAAVLVLLPGAWRNATNSVAWQHRFVDRIPGEHLTRFAASLPEGERAAFALASSTSQRERLHAVVRPEFVLMGLGGGVTFHAGNSPRFAAAYDVVDPDDLLDGTFRTEDLLLREGLIGGAAAWERWHYSAGWQAIGQDPLWWLGHLGRKSADLMGGPEHKRQRDVYLTREFSPLLAVTVWSAGLDFPWGLAAPLAALGAAAAVRRAWRTRSLAALVPLALAVAYLAPFVFFAPCARYRYPAMVLLLPYAVVGLALLLRAPSRNRVIAAAAVALLANIPAPAVPAGDDWYWLAASWAQQAERAAGQGDKSLAAAQLTRAIGAAELSVSTEPVIRRAHTQLDALRVRLRELTAGGGP